MIDQSKLAFKERKLSSYEISSNYSIIWITTNECYFNCPICATCSGINETCKLTYQDKLNILLNLASINGNIVSLDISGGVPLKNENDRKLIKKAHQILAYTDIKVTTTGKALESKNIDEMYSPEKFMEIVNKYMKDKEYQGANYKENPFYLGDLNERTMYEKLTDPITIKLAK